MNILEQISKDLKEAFLKREKVKISALKLLLAAIHNKEIELRGQKKKLDETAVIETIKKEAKKRKEAIVIYEKTTRVDLLNQEKEELQILEKYLPQELSDEEIKKIIKEKISLLNNELNFGEIMAEVVKETKGRADGKRVADLVKAELTILSYPQGAE